MLQAQLDLAARSLFLLEVALMHRGKALPHTMFGGKHLQVCNVSHFVCLSALLVYT
jgi:hypothetical protein